MSKFLTRLTEDIAYIQQLGDNPNADNGLTPAALKAWFDKAPEAIKAYLNDTFIPEIEKKFGSLDEWITQASEKIDNFAIGSGFLPTDGSVPMSGPLNMAQKKVMNLAAPEADTDAVNKKYVDDVAGGVARTAQSNFDSATNAANNAATAAVNAQSTADSKSKATGLTVTLGVAGWSSKKQAVSAAGVLAGETKCHVVISPTEASREAYNDAVVRCTAQGSNTLTFTCDDVPSVDLKVNVLVIV